MLFLHSLFALIPGLLVAPQRDLNTAPSLSMAPSNNDLHLPQVPLDVENYPVAPAELALEQVHIYIRHGARPNYTSSFEF